MSKTTFLGNNSSGLIWNMLGTFYEDRTNKDYQANSYIKYVLPKQYIWRRRSDLKGAELQVGYVESAPFVFAKETNMSGNTTVGGINHSTEV